MGWLFGHNFQPRVDDTQTYTPDSAERLERALSRVTGLKQVVLSEDVEAIRHITTGFNDLNTNETYYVQDVCTRCGALVERMPDPVEDMDADELLSAALENMHGLSPNEWEGIKAIIPDIIERAEYKAVTPDVLPLIVAENLEEAEPEERSELVKVLLAELLRRKEAAAALPAVLPIECPSCHTSFNPLDSALPFSRTNPVTPLDDGPDKAA